MSKPYWAGPSYKSTVTTGGKSSSSSGGGSSGSSSKLTAEQRRANIQAALDKVRASHGGVTGNITGVASVKGGVRISVKDPKTGEITTGVITQEQYKQYLQENREANKPKITERQEFQKSILERQGYNVQVSESGVVSGSKGGRQVTITPKGKIAEAPTSATIRSEFIPLLPTEKIQGQVTTPYIPQEKKTTGEQYKSYRAQRIADTLRKQGYKVSVIGSRVKATKEGKTTYIDAEVEAVLPSTAKYRPEFRTSFGYDERVREHKREKLISYFQHPYKKGHDLPTPEGKPITTLRQAVRSGVPLTEFYAQKLKFVTPQDYKERPFSTGLAAVTTSAGYGVGSVYEYTKKHPVKAGIVAGAFYVGGLGAGAIGTGLGLSPQATSLLYGGAVIGGSYVIGAVKEPGLRTVPGVISYAAGTGAFLSGAKLLGSGFKFAKETLPYFGSKSIKLKTEYASEPVKETFEVKPYKKYGTVETSVRVPTIEYRMQGQKVSTVSPDTYARIGASKGKFYYTITELEKGIYGRFIQFRSGKPAIEINAPYRFTSQESVLSHELIHFKTPKFLRETKLENLPYKLRPSEQIAFGLERYYAKGGFKLTHEEIFNYVESSKTNLLLRKTDEPLTFYYPRRQVQTGSTGRNEPKVATVKGEIRKGINTYKLAITTKGREIYGTMEDISPLKFSHRKFDIILTKSKYGDIRLLYTKGEQVLQEKFLEYRRPTTSFKREQITNVHLKNPPAFRDVGHEIEKGVVAWFTRSKAISKEVNTLARRSEFKGGRDIYERFKGRATSTMLQKDIATKKITRVERLAGTEKGIKRKGIVSPLIKESATLKYVIQPNYRPNVKIFEGEYQISYIEPNVKTTRFRYDIGKTQYKQKISRVKPLKVISEHMERLGSGKRPYLQSSLLPVPLGVTKKPVIVEIPEPVLKNVKLDTRPGVAVETLFEIIENRPTIPTTRFGYSPLSSKPTKKTTIEKVFVFNAPKGALMPKTFNIPLSSTFVNHKTPVISKTFIPVRTKTETPTISRTFTPTKSYMKVPVRIITRTTTQTKTLAQTRTVTKVQTGMFTASFNRPNIGFPDVPPPPVASMSFFKIESSIASAFNVLIKRRGRFKTIATGLPVGKALKFGAKETRRTLAATFKLVQKGETKEEDISYKPNPNVFRSYKIQKGQRIETPFQFIQKRKFRLSSSSEVGEIQMFRRRA